VKESFNIREGLPMRKISKHFYGLGAKQKTIIVN